ncbi:hypothetical protein [Microbispora sp. NPDC049125]|uniref:hypothetical protein n=1 Tax=Microbispora sp. NPDC049125 TaxID=3154929 RepID=UPI0034651CC1
MWGKILQYRAEVEDGYTAKTGFKLFATPNAPEIVTKPYDSLLDKSFRKNVAQNSGWPSPPDGGWVTPLNWYGRVNDIVRTTVVVKYLDGVGIIVDHIRQMADSCKIRFSVDYEAREEGYYAAHCYLWFDLEIPAANWDTERVSIRLEIQVTTQLQDVIRRLTHDYYTQRRSRTSVADVKWQWDYKNPEFIPNYLGHILHYVEGMIMEVRERGGRK